MCVWGEVGWGGGGALDITLCYDWVCMCIVLVHSEDLTLGFIRLNNLPAVHTVEIKNGQEYILCFNSKHYYNNYTDILTCKQY